MGYEESLETMTEEQLRAECLRLSEQLGLATTKLLTQPVLDTRPKEVVLADLERQIAENQQEFRRTCQKDMSKPTTAEINSVNELVALVVERNRLKECHDSSGKKH